MKWVEMTPEQRDRLVAEKVMDWQAKECDGEMGEKPISPDGWFCRKCGYDGYWGDDFTHEQRPPRYTQSLDRAWKIVEHFRDRFDVHVGSAPLQYDVAFLGRRMSGRYFTASAKSAQEAICLAALKAVGVEVE